MRIGFDMPDIDAIDFQKRCIDKKTDMSKVIRAQIKKWMMENPVSDKQRMKQAVE